MVYSIFRGPEKHKCTLKYHSVIDDLPKLPHDATWFERWWCKLRRTLTISEYHPRSTEFYRSYVNIIQMRKEHLTNHPFIIHPFSLFRVFYEIYMAVVFTLVLVMMPIAASYDYLFQGSEAYDNCEKVLTALCVFDILMIFVTGYAITKEKKVITDPGKIAKHYLFGINFYCDVLSCLTIVRTENFIINKLTDFTGVLRISRLPTVFEYINRTSEFFKTMHTSFKILRCAIVTFILLHWFACFLFLVPQFAQLSESTVLDLKVHNGSWIYQMNLQRGNFMPLYAPSIYRGTATLLCIEVSMQKEWILCDVLSSVLSYVFGRIFFFFMTVVVSQMLLSHRSLTTKYFETMNQVEGYMKQKQLPPAMQKKIVEFYDYKYNKKLLNEKNINSLLSDNIKKEINMHVCKTLIQSVTIFNNLPIKSVEDILANLTSEIFLPNDLIIRAGTVGDSMYFIARGTVAVSTPSGKEVCHLEDGAYFGEISMVIKDQKRTANIIALEICEVYKLAKAGFKNVFSKHIYLVQTLETTAKERMVETQLVEDTCKQTFLGRKR